MIGTNARYDVSKSDIFFITLPWWDNFTPAAAPGVLKGIVESHGFSMELYDSNIDLQYEICGNDQHLYNKLVNYFITSTTDFEHQSLIDRFYTHVIEKIQQKETRFLAFSVFSVFTHRAIYDILTRLRPVLDIPIVLGGRGLTTRPNLSILKFLSATEKVSHFSDIIRKRSLADYLILGDGEDAIVDLLTGSYSNTTYTHHVAKKNTLDYPFSNFDGLRLEKYSGMGGTQQLPIISSKGCVRSCDFCDVAAQMKRFQSKNGGRLAQEAIYLADRYNIREFYMADSIANGNMKSLTEFCEKLAEHNINSEPNQKITWSGNWISRPPNSIKQPFYDLMARSGCRSVTVGAEHASNRVLEAMVKKTVVEGLQFDLEQFSRTGITSILNLIVGHWSEEFDDFIKLYDFLLKQGRYIANGTINAFHTTTYAALDNTPSVHHGNTNQLMRADDNFTNLWYTKKNPKSTIKVRLARWITVIEFYEFFNLTKVEQWNDLQNLLHRIKDSGHVWEEFFHNAVIDNSNHITCEQTLTFMETHKSYLTESLKKMFPETTMKLKVNAFHCNGAPCLFIKLNGNDLYRSDLYEGSNEISIDIPNDFDNESVLEIGMIKKNPGDTLVNEHGDIIKDKKILIESLTMDTVNIFNDKNYFYHRLEYIEHGDIQPISRPGFFFNNSSLRIKFRGSFWHHYLSSRQSPSWLIDEDRRKQIPNLVAELKSLIKGLKY